MPKMRQAKYQGLWESLESLPGMYLHFMQDTDMILSVADEGLEGPSKKPRVSLESYTNHQGERFELEVWCWSWWGWKVESIKIYLEVWVEDKSIRLCDGSRYGMQRESLEVSKMILGFLAKATPRTLMPFTSIRKIKVLRLGLFCCCCHFCLVFLFYFKFCLVWFSAVWHIGLNSVPSKFMSK